MAEQAARTGAGEVDPDAELLAQCAIVNQVNVRPVVVDLDTWQRAVLQASSLRALTLAGLRAKLEIALMLIGVEPQPGDEVQHLDRTVLWPMLTEVLSLVDDA